MDINNFIKSLSEKKDLEYASKTDNDLADSKKSVNDVNTEIENTKEPFVNLEKADLEDYDLQDKFKHDEISDNVDDYTSYDKTANIIDNTNANDQIHRAEIGKKNTNDVDLVKGYVHTKVETKKDVLPTKEKKIDEDGEGAVAVADVAPSADVSSSEVADCASPGTSTNDIANIEAVVGLFSRDDKNRKEGPFSKYVGGFDLDF